jgi:hypothetical protein
MRMVPSLLPDTSMLVSPLKQSVEHLVGRAASKSSSAPGEFGVGMVVEGALRSVGVSQEVSAAVGSVGAAAVGAMNADEVDEDISGTVRLGCHSTASSLQVENGTMQLWMPPGGVVMLVDDSAAGVGAVVGVEDIGGTTEDDDTGDRDATALVLRVRHIPAFASSIICSMKVICVDNASSFSSMVDIGVVRVGGELAESSGSGGDEPCSGTKCHAPR